MLADYESKPTQGTIFCRQRAKLKNFPLDYDDNVECRRTHPKLLTNIEADTVGGILEMMPQRVCVEDNEKAVKLAYNSSSTNFVTQDIVEGGKSLSQRAENSLLVQRRSLLGVSAPRGS